MRVRLPHSNGLFLSRWGTPLTDLRASVPDGKRFCPGKFVPVSKIEGNVPCLGPKSIHFVGYLPLVTIQAADGKQYDTLSLPLEYLPGWLFGINASRVKPELKDKVIQYQLECFRIFWQAFQNRAATPDVIPQLVADQAETRARVDIIDQSVKEIKVILSEIRGLSTEHRATAQKMVNEISKISGIPYAHIYGDLKKYLHTRSYTAIDDEKWAEVQKWLQQHLNTARQGKGIEQQPSLFEDGE